MWNSTSALIQDVNILERRATEKVLKIFSFLVRYCQDPPSPPVGGTYDWDANLTLVTPYLTEVHYECSKGRMFKSSTESYRRQCTWEKTWEPAEAVTYDLKFPHNSKQQDGQF